MCLYEVLQDFPLVNYHMVNFSVRLRFYKPRQFHTQSLQASCSAVALRVITRVRNLGTLGSRLKFCPM